MTEAAPVTPPEYVGEATHRGGPIFDRTVSPQIAERLFGHLHNGSTDSSDRIIRYSPRVYTDSLLGRNELNLIFRRTPLIVAHTSELPAPRDFITVQLPGASVLVVRQVDGGVKAFINSCRHRGTVLTSEPTGNRRVFTCPYHAWSYNPDGSLRAITDAQTVGELDKKTLGLIEVPSEDRHGFVWVVPSPEATIDVARALGPEMDEIMASYHLDRYFMYRIESFERSANWKLMFDAFLDNYHIRYLHASSVGPFFHNNTMLIDNFGKQSRIVSTRRSIDSVRDQRVEDVALDKHVTLGHLIWPNTQLLRQPTHFEQFSFIPDADDPGRARMDIRLIVPEPPESDSQLNRWEKNWEILMQTIVTEDLVNCESLQRAMANDHVEWLLFAKNELFNQIFHRELISAVGRESFGDDLGRFYQDDAASSASNA